MVMGRYLLVLCVFGTWSSAAVKCERRLVSSERPALSGIVSASELRGVMFLLRGTRSGDDSGVVGFSCWVAESRRRRGGLPVAFALALLRGLRMGGETAVAWLVWRIVS